LDRLRRLGRCWARFNRPSTQPATAHPPSRHPARRPPTTQPPPERHVVLTGGKLRKEIYAAFEQIYPVLQVRVRVRG